MTRLLLLLACAVVAALLWPRRRAPLDDREEALPPADPRLVALTYYWRTPAGVQPVVQVVPEREAAG